MANYNELIARVRSPYALTERDAQEIADALEARGKRIDELESRLVDKDVRIAELEAALTDCADALESWVDDIYAKGSVPAGYGTKYERDVAVVNAARAALKGEK